jgi:hypothetical protein
MQNGSEGVRVLYPGGERRTKGDRALIVATAGVTG